jgi:hypothetical protein
MAEIASGLTRVASVPALNASKRSLAIWERAELWVHRKRTLPRSGQPSVLGLPSRWAAVSAIRCLAASRSSE